VAASVVEDEESIDDVVIANKLIIIATSTSIAFRAGYRWEHHIWANA
jgi:hypothetical protein